VSRRNIRDTSAIPPGIKREWYVCMYDSNPNCQIFPIKSILYGELIEVKGQLEKFDSFVHPHMTVRSTACHSTQLQFDIRTYALVIRAVHIPKCIE
jgi:hypothetical protein